MKPPTKLPSPRKHLLTLAISLCAVGAAHGQTLSTGTFTDHTFLTLAGPAANELYGVATNGGTATITTDNGYNFVGSASAAGQADITSSGRVDGTFTGFLGSTTTGDTGLNGVINTSLYGGPQTYTLNNLTPGSTYTVLVLASDSRPPGSSGDSNFRIEDGAAVSAFQTFVFPNGVGGAGLQTEGGYLLDTFTATGASHTITVDGFQEDQGILVEMAVPEPSTWAVLGLGAGLLGLVLRRRVRCV